MAYLFLRDRLAKVDEISKDSVNGWMRAHGKHLNLSAIPAMINAIVMLFFHPDEIFDSDATNNIVLSANKKCMLSVDSSSSPDEEFMKLYKTGYGLNQINLNDNCNWIYQWDIKINKHNEHSDIKVKERDMFIPIFIGLASDQLSNAYCVFGHGSTDGLQFMYCSDGEVFIDSSECEWKAYGQDYGEDDIITIFLNLRKMTIEFRLNGRNQGIAYSNIKDCGNDKTKLKLSVTINTATTSAQIIKFARYR